MPSVTLDDTSVAQRSRARRLAPPLLTAAVVGLGSLALRLRDPHVTGSWGMCPTKLFTGGDCPGCGGLRAVNDLTHGDVLAAASSNLMFVASIPLLVVWWVLWVRRASRNEYWEPGPATTYLAWGVLALQVVFTIVRNQPGSWLAS